MKDSVKRVAVIGGGPAGCTAAYTLRKQGCDVHLFELSDQIGGRTSQIHREGFNLSTGALFLMGGIYPRTNAILKELGHDKDLVPWKATTHVVDWDRHRYTARFDSVMAIGVIKVWLSPGPRSLFNGAELALYDHGETLDTWSDRVLGKKGTNYLTLPYMGFLYAVPLEWQSTPLFHGVVQQFYKLSLQVPPEGVGQFSEWLVEGSPGLDLHLSCPATAIRTRDGGYKVDAGDKSYDVDGVVVASEPGVAADLLDNTISPDSVAKLRGCRYSQYAHVQLCYKKNPWPNFPAAVALPATDLRNWGACALLSRRHPNSVPPGGEAVGVYFYTPPLANMTDEDIKREALMAVTEVFGAAPKPDFIHLFHYKRGLSLSPPGHFATLDSLHAEMPKGVVLAGDYFAHAGVEAAVLSGERAAKWLLGREQ
ncbi:FAD NAD(P)-binding domain-containing [Fusarium albosuccineum]|uniref:FAD NAD(P)-binding domain-containing n=1 Tax=Fusarium albosuccineum TaxID=1237068 RepID=A0A8H4P468_9HYPO|nr:FAD NAD(P)-binding domain-containing [Fusarium albosuccineum]